MSEGTLKHGWTLVSFGDMAEHVAERVEPTPNDGETYVGLEHLDSGSLTVRRWGAEVALIGTKLRMRKGDILFARRNAYLRRVALAPHDGLFSAHGMVLRARPRVMVPELLPFFMQSDLFMDRAEQISVGSLSPTINWGTLKEQKFALPPLEEQRRIAIPLQAAARVDDCLGNALSKARSVQESLLWKYFPAGQLATVDWPTLEELTLRVNDGTHQPPPFVPSGVPFLLVGNIASGRVNWVAGKYVSEEVFEQLSRSWRPQLDDVLYSLVGSFGIPAMVDREVPFTFQRHIGLIRCDPDRLIPKFLYWYLKSPSGVQQAHLRAEGLAQRTITLGALRSFRIPEPTIDVQRELVLRLDASQGAIDAVSDRTSAVRRIGGEFAAARLRGGE